MATIIKFIKIILSVFCVIVILAGISFFFNSKERSVGTGIVGVILGLLPIYLMWFRKNIGTSKNKEISFNISTSVSTGVDKNNPPVPRYIRIGFPKEVLALVMFADGKTYYEKSSNSFHVLKKYDQDFVKPVIKRTEHGLDIWFFDHISDNQMHQLYKILKDKSYLEIDADKSSLNSMSVQALRDLAKHSGIVRKGSKKEDIIKELMAQLPEAELDKINLIQYFKPTSLGDEVLNDYKLQLLVYKKGWGFNAKDINNAVKISSDMEKQIEYLFIEELNSLYKNNDFGFYIIACGTYSRYLEETGSIHSACYYYFLRIYIELSGLSNRGSILPKTLLMITNYDIDNIIRCFKAQNLGIDDGMKLIKQFQEKLPTLKFQYYSFNNVCGVLRDLLLVGDSFSTEDMKNILGKYKSKAEPKHLQELKKEFGG